MKFKVFKDKIPTDTITISIRENEDEPSIFVVDSEGNFKYSLLGIRHDGTFVSYSGSREQKNKDGFKTNKGGQLLYFSNAIDLSS